MNLEQALKEIRRLEEIIETLNEHIADQELTIADLEEKNAELEQQIEDSWVPVRDEDLQELEERVFLRDIGLDPDRLPTSVGERMALRDSLQERPS